MPGAAITELYSGADPDYMQAARKALDKLLVRRLGAW